MKRRNFLVAWITSILYAIFPSLRPKPLPYGGKDLRDLLIGNSGFRRLEMPYFIEEGVPIGLMPPIGLRLEAEPIHFELEEKAGPGKLEFTEELCDDMYVTTEQHGDPCICGCNGAGSTRVTPAS